MDLNQEEFDKRINKAIDEKIINLEIQLNQQQEYINEITKILTGIQKNIDLKTVKSKSARNSIRRISDKTDSTSKGLQGRKSIKKIDGEGEPKRIFIETLSISFNPLEEPHSTNEIKHGDELICNGSNNKNE